ncbi:DUF4395 domain-containing protein [Actinokineospora globicatena]|uniref:Membrane protein n=1 Tax=Actinokineospora globicatena TaxID=103729 RepID=A0A9W6QJW9_9PSEU|nr:DUF4395 domain-containing protein [Actinokineospora globicatena]MCP2301520.1 protein of unknown function (DUF4395) [Actinokineospora globicatena]GLW76833.1 membrane protein [Actinokineospora globicatena]GLW83666.1 membrane protein [Actinokineospora globicatena]GLW92386.1 membrane protein [Actinokineospora globicatena]
MPAPPLAPRPTVDPRGPRFAAWLTSAVLVVVLATGWWPLLAAQAVVFALGGFAGLRYSPYSVLFRAVVAPRLRPTDEREDAAPPRFAQTVGFGFAVVGVLGYALGAPTVGVVATALALAAAFLNAAFGFCLGCEAYLLINRLSAKQRKVGTAR